MHRAQPKPKSDVDGYLSCSVPSLSFHFGALNTSKNTEPVAVVRLVTVHPVDRIMRHFLEFVTELLEPVGEWRVYYAFFHYVLFKF